MIIVVRKRNIFLVLLIFLLSITIYSLNIGNDDAVSETSGKNTDRVVLLDPGHGGEDPGVVSQFSGIKESDINLYIANKVRELLEAQNYTVKMTRTEDRLEYTPGITSETEMRKQDLTRRKKIIDELGTGIVVSIHLNGFPQAKYFGAQTFFPPDSSDSQKLAGCLQKAVRDTVDPNNKRQPQVKKPQVKGNIKTQIMIFREVKVPIAVVECGFLSNVEEEKKLATREYQDKLAEAIKNGIMAYYDEKKPQ